MKKLLSLVAIALSLFSTAAFADVILNPSIQGGTMRGTTVFLPNSNTLPGSCSVGQVYVKNDATTSQRLYVCESGVFVAQGAGATVTATGATNDIQINAGAGAFGHITPGSGATSAITTNVGAPGSIIVNGGALGTPGSGNGVNLTALNASNLGSGTVPAARLPNPSASTLGGVQSAASVLHQFVTSISTSGVAALAQPAATDISGLAASATTDTTVASNISSGALPAARMPALTGDITTSAGAVATTLATVATPGTAMKITFNAKGLVTSGAAAAASDLSNGTTGSGAVVLVTSGTLITPALGTPSALVCTNCSGTAANLTAGAVTIARQTFSNANAVITAGNTVVEQIGTMSASRTLTLAAASAYPAGQRVFVVDVSGTVTSANTVVVTRAGSDTINAGTTDTIGAAYGSSLYETDGTSKWTVISRPTLNTGTLTDTNVFTYDAAATAAKATTGVASANTPSAIVQRDGSGNFAGGIYTGSVTGHASLDLSLAGTSQAFTGGIAPTAVSLATGNITVNCGTAPLQYITNGGAYTITAPAADGHCLLLVTNNGSAGATTFSGFTVGSSTGDALTTTNTNKFMLSIMRVNSVPTYIIKALQ